MIDKPVEDPFPSFPPGGRSRIPQRLLDAAQGDITTAFVLWWAEAEQMAIQKLIEDLKRPL